MPNLSSALRSAAAFVAACLALFGAPSFARGQGSPAELVQRAATAMGGADALKGLNNVTYEFNLAQFGLGQEETPFSPARATFNFGRITTDYRGARRLITQESRAVTGAVRIRRVITPTMGMTETNGVFSVDNPGAVAAAGTEIRAQLDRVILSALDNPSQLRSVPPKSIRNEQVDGVRLGSGTDAPTVWFDRITHLPIAVERVTDDPILGDRHTVNLYSRWQDAGGLLLPRQIDVDVNGRRFSHNVLTSASVNATLNESDFAIPDSITRRAAAAPPTAPGPAPITVTLAELGPGVWRAEGGSHHSLVIRQATGLVVVETPQSTARSRAVIDTLRARIPGISVRTIVPTHHHWDHSGGIREYLGHNVEVVVHPRNVEFVRAIGAAQKSVAPDALSRSGRSPTVRPSTDGMVLGTGDTSVQLFNLPSAHAEGILAAYVPSLRILFVSDVLTPGPTLAPAGSREIVAMVRAKNIVVDRVVGGHGGIAAWADVVAASAR